MRFLRSFIRHEPVLCAALLAAAVSCFFVAPDAEYLNYIDLRTLALLYCLMVVVAGLSRAGLFSYMADTLCKKAASLRVLSLILVLLCFFSSMLITNDVALLTFVPFTVIVLHMAGQTSSMIPVIVLQTVAANLGSMLTPVGNPQNLYLYSHYEFSFGSFISVTAPIWGLSLILVIAGCLFIKSRKIQVSDSTVPVIRKPGLLLYAALFVICLLVVLRVMTWPVMLCVIAAALLVLDRKTLLQADFFLLLTFVAFFIFAGNLARIEAVDALLRSLMQGREYATSLIASQFISNVPAALVLSGFTGNAPALLLGVNIGGLGTPVASLASLISMKLYFHTLEARKGRYMLVFTAVNIVLLIILSAAHLFYF